MRVRLIFPFLCEIERIDYRGGSYAGDFDPVFQDVRTVTIGGKREVLRPEKAAIRVRCQIEDEQFDALRMFNAGDSPEAKLSLSVDFYHLKRLDRVDPVTGLARLDNNDRLSRIFTTRGDLVHVVKDPPGLYCIESRPISYGMGGRVNLLLLRFNDRAQSQGA